MSARLLENPLIETAWLREMAKTHRSDLLTLTITAQDSDYAEHQYWSFTDPVLLRGHQYPIW